LLLQPLDTHFQSVSGYPLLDLQNEMTPEAMITPERVMDQIATYTSEAKTLYWAFFILDTIMPPLTFGSFALLWVLLFKRNPTRITQWLLGSYLLLIPLGVGFFDWWENLSYITAIHNYPNPGTMTAVVIGLVFKWVKAAFIPPTFLLTLVFIGYYVYRVIRYELLKKRQFA
jgi:phosphoglycerol transferase MdoB-like AlkP superfamily enzyme